MYKNVLEMIEFNISKIPNQIAAEDDNAKISYMELGDYSKRIGTALNYELRQVNKPIVVLMNKSIKNLIAFFGIVYSGNFYVCIDVNMGVERIEKIFDVLEPAAAISDAEFVSKWKFNIPIYDYEKLISYNVNDKILKLIRRNSTDADPLYVLFTSGSTGVPKGAVISHRSVIAYAEWVVKTFSFDTKTIIGNQVPFYFSMSVLDIYASIYAGATLSIIPKSLFSFPVPLLKYINQKGINTIYWVPSALSIVSNWDAFDYVNIDGLKKVLFAGEVMPTKILNKWRANLPDAIYANLFGPTEITDIGLYYIVDRNFKDDEPLPIGISCENMDAFALDDNGKKIEIGDNLIGELYFRGVFVGNGYYKNKEKTDEVFVQNPLNSDYKEIVYRTGDLVKIANSGEFYYVGRKDLQIKHMGNRIELGEIEAIAIAIEEIETVVCLYDEDKDRIKLLYKGNKEENIIHQILKDKLPLYMLPNDIIRVESIELNANGKIDRKKLQQKYIGG